MGSHFHDLTDPNGIDFNGIDYNRVDCNGIDYGIDFNDFNWVIRIGSHIFGKKKYLLSRDLKMGKFAVKSWLYKVDV